MDNLPRKPHLDCGYMLCTRCVSEMYPENVPINCFCGVDNAEPFHEIITGEMSVEEKVRIILEKVPIH